MRIDQLLCYLRFVRTRGLAQKLIDTGMVRCNGERVLRHSHAVTIGDVLTFPSGNGVTIAEILGLPERRGPAGVAQSYYRLLDPQV